MADLLEGTLPLNLVAIDIAHYSNAVLIELSDRKRQRFRMTNSAPDFDRLLSYLQALPGNCRVALEPTGDYHRPLAHRLLTAGHEWSASIPWHRRGIAKRCSTLGTRTIPRTRRSSWKCSGVAHISATWTRSVDVRTELTH
ncbi:IS110 family transposase [Burkholderia cepacia]|uniref:IS110 family transposase n=1 Tax=Burkholderia cepacia TaxID=292 RepID=UPI0038575A98